MQICNHKKDNKQWINLWRYEEEEKRVFLYYFLYYLVFLFIPFLLGVCFDCPYIQQLFAFVAFHFGL